MTELLQSDVSTEKFGTRFADFAEGRKSNDPSWLPPRREAALARFRELGVPTKRHEDWKYTNLTPLLKTELKAPSESKTTLPTLEDLERFTYFESSSARLVLVNGVYSEDLSCLRHLPEGARVTSLRSVLDDSPELLEEHFGQQVQHEKNAFRALNTAFAIDGAFIHLPPGCRIEGAVHVLYLATSADSNVIAHPRNVIIAETGSHATIVERYAALEGAGTYFNNVSTDIMVGANASIEHYKIQRESELAFHLAHTEVRQDRDSRFESTLISVGGLISRNDLDVKQDDTQTTTTLNGLYVADGKRHVDNRVCVDHAKSHGSSQQFYKGILDDEATGVFNGKIVAEESTVGTDAHQTNKNLLLSDTAVVDTRPQLEIYADDIKCSHGATVGQLDESQVFYMRSRGISEDRARSILTSAFASDVVDRIRIEPIRARVHEFLTTQMKWGTDTEEAR